MQERSTVQWLSEDNRLKNWVYNKVIQLLKVCRRKAARRSTRTLCWATSGAAETVMKAITHKLNSSLSESRAIASHYWLRWLGELQLGASILSYKKSTWPRSKVKKSSKNRPVTFQRTRLWRLKRSRKMQTLFLILTDQSSRTHPCQLFILFKA